MENLKGIKALISEYISASEALLLKAGPMDGFLGLGNDPRKNSIHTDCYDRMEKTLSDAAASGISEEEAYAVCAYILRAEKELKCCEMAKAMLTAFQGTIVPLIPLVSGEHKAELLQWLTGEYPRWTRVPVQEKIIKMLK